MPDFNVRADSVNVEQIMEQIRGRIREKRGADYTEQQIRELAAVKLEKFLDPRGVRSDLLEQFRRAQPEPQAPDVPLYAFEDSTMFDSHRGLLRAFRRLLRPMLKLFFNPNVVAHVLHAQAEVNRQYLERIQTLESRARQQGELYYELLHNLVVEVTRLGIETKNMKMRVESLSSRLEFNERRARALESVVVYQPSPERLEPEPASSAATGIETGAAERPQAPPQPGGAPPEGPGQRSRRRRRRRGRRSGAPAAAMMGGAPGGGADRADLAAHEAGEGHPETAERIEQALGEASHASESRDEGPDPDASGPTPGSGGPDTDQQ